MRAPAAKSTSFCCAIAEAYGVSECREQNMVACEAVALFRTEEGFSLTLQAQIKGCKAVESCRHFTQQLVVFAPFNPATSKRIFSATD